MGESTLGAFDTVLGAAAAALVDAGTVKGATDNVVTNTRKVFDPPATDEDDAVLLKAVPLVGNVGDDFIPAGKTDLGHLPDSGIRLLGGTGHDLGANPTAKRIFAQGR